jgi:hypothetical protein
MGVGTIKKIVSKKRNKNDRIDRCVLNNLLQNSANNFSVVVNHLEM